MASDEAVAAVLVAGVEVLQQQDLALADQDQMHFGDQAEAGHCAVMSGRRVKAEVVRRQAREHLEDLTGYANLVIGDLLSEMAHLDERISQYDRHVHAMAKQSKAAQQLMQRMGIGEATATALAAMVAMAGNATEFSCGRQFSAWIGLVPGQYSSGGKARLGRI